MITSIQKVERYFFVHFFVQRFLIHINLEAANYKFEYLKEIIPNSKGKQLRLKCKNAIIHQIICRHMAQKKLFVYVFRHVAKLSAKREFTEVKLVRYLSILGSKSCYWLSLDCYDIIYVQFYRLWRKSFISSSIVCFEKPSGHGILEQCRQRQDCLHANHIGFNK